MGDRETKLKHHQVKNSVFWEILDLANVLFIYEGSGRLELYEKTIEANRELLSVENLGNFQMAFNQKLHDLFLPKIVEVFYLTAYGLKKDWGYISNDGFLDFRAWIISLGQKKFMKFILFEHENEILEFDFNPNYAFREDLVYFGKDTYSRLHGGKGNLVEMKAVAGWEGWEALPKMDFDEQRLLTKYSKLISKYQKRC